MMMLFLPGLQGDECGANKTKGSLKGDKPPNVAGAHSFFQ